ncbi:MAG: ABC transporter ATP-binding protein [Actinobacteria bacterium]|nr:ABC transporter ATP-binding protein [Actinomycetota bacterium]
MTTTTLLPATGTSGPVHALQPAAARVYDAVKVYGRGENEVRALDGVSVEFATGRFTAIMGPSGSGKSTLMHCMAGLDRLTSGQVFIDDIDLGAADREALVAEMLGLVGLTGLESRRPHELSGGQQQRVAVARALAGRPEIIFADEPTGNLDSRTGAEILSFMRTAVREFGQTIVMVTHDPVAASYADRAVFLADGRIVDDLDAPTAGSVLDRIRTLGG